VLGHWGGAHGRKNVLLLCLVRHSAKGLAAQLRMTLRCGAY
jgi:hypothetical protein